MTCGPRFVAPVYLGRRQTLLATTLIWMRWGLPTEEASDNTFESGNLPPQASISRILDVHPMQQHPRGL